MRLRQQRWGTLLTLAQRSLDAPEVWRQTRGWPFAAQLIARGVEPDAPNLLAALFAPLPEGLKAALVDLAVLDIWQEDDVARLGTTLPQGWLDLLKESGLPLRAAEADTCQPHELVRHLLLDLLQKDPERYQAKQRVASTLYEERDALLSAIAAALEAQALERALSLSREPVRRWIWRWEWATARQHLNLFVNEQLPTDMQNLYGHSLIQTGDPAAGLKILEQVVASGKANALTYVGLAMVAVQQGDHAQVAELTNLGLTLDPEPLELILLTQLKALSLAGNDWAAAYEAAEQADMIAKFSGHNILGIMTATAKAYAAQGLTHERAEDAARTLNQTRESLRGQVSAALEEGFSNHAFTALTMVAHLDFQVGESDKSIGLVHRSLGLSQRNHPYVTPYLLLRLGDHLQEKGEFAGAAVYYQQALDLCVAADIKTLTHLCTFALCECFAYLGREIEAHQLLEELENGSLPASTRAFVDPSYVYIKGLLAVRLGIFDEAEAAFKQFVEVAPSLVDYRHRIGLGYTYKAELARRRGQVQREHIDTLVYWLDQTQAHWTLKREASFLESLFKYCMAQSWHTDLFNKLLEETSSQRKLSLRTFGEVQMRLNGQQLKLYPKARDLLAYLALYGPATRSDILRDLWGETSESSIRSFKVHLSAIRREAERVLESSADFVAYDLLSHLYSCPLVRVESDLAQLSHAAEHASPEVRLAAVRNYRTFLANVTTSWAQEKRQEIEQMVVRLALDTAASLPDNEARLKIQFAMAAAALDPSGEAERTLRRFSLVADEGVRGTAHQALDKLAVSYRLDDL